MRAKPYLLWAGSKISSWFTYLTHKNEQVMTPDNEQDSAVQAYRETMSALFLKQEVPEAKADEEARYRALAYTVTVLRSISVARRAILIEFLSQSGLLLLGIGTDLQALNLNGADLSHLNLGKVKLSEANLSHAKLMNGDLRDADLRGANLSWADLRGANLSKSDLRGTDLSRAYLHAAYLSGADLSGAILRDAVVTPEQVRQARASRHM
jgi:hypothetical protein